MFISTFSLVPVVNVVLLGIIGGIIIVGKLLTEKFTKSILRKELKSSFTSRSIIAFGAATAITGLGSVAPIPFISGFPQLISAITSNWLNFSPAAATINILLFIFIFLAILAILIFQPDQLLSSTARPTRIFFYLLPLFLLFIFYYLDSRLEVGRYYYSLHIPAALAAILASLVIGLQLSLQLSRQRLLIVPIMLCLCGLFVAAKYFEVNQTVKALFWHRGVIGKKYLKFIKHTIDKDQDHYSPFLGGGDCDDAAPAINLAAQDKISNGHDDNCLGGDFQQPWPELSAINQAPIAKSQVKNIIFITVDCLRADHLGCYGYPGNFSANIDRFAKRGILFTNAYAPGTNTGHSFSAIARACNGNAIFDESVPTIAEVLEENDLDTAVLSAPATKHWLNKKRWVRYKNIMLKGYTQILHRGAEYWDSQRLTDEALAYLKKRDDEPFYLWIHYDDMHAKGASYQPFGSGGKSTRPIDIYDGNLVYTDQHIGRLLEYLEAENLFTNTLIVISADHGEEFGEHGQQFHGGRPYRSQTHVPLIIWYPGVIKNIVDTPVSTIDLGPTFLRATGIMPPGQYKGIDLYQIVTGRAPARPIIIETPRNIPEGESMAWALVDGDWQLIFDATGYTFELYNIKSDIAEHRNLFDSERKRGAAMAAMLGQWFDTQSQNTEINSLTKFE